MSSPASISRDASKRPKPGTRLTLLSWLAAAALAVSACGSGSGESGGQQADADVMADDVAAEPASGDEGTDTTAPSATTTAEAAESEDTEAEMAEEAADDAVEANFPVVEVVNLADGSNVQLADELAGGDKPILLWFWAPH